MLMFIRATGIMERVDTWRTENLALNTALGFILSGCTQLIMKTLQRLAAGAKKR